MDWKKYLKDKRVWAAGAVVAAIAAVAVIRNRGAGGDGGGGAPVGSGANPAGFYQQAADTTGTDLSGFLSNWASSQNQAQQLGFQAILDALKGGGTTPNADPPPAVPASVVYTKDPGGNVSWALLNSPYGGWMSTNSQAQANSWAQQYEPDQNANYVDYSAWTKLKEKWNK